MKYVRLRRHGDEFFVFCLAPLTHGLLAKPWIDQGYTPLSAGFVIFDPLTGIRTTGQSLSLGLQPLGDDARMIDFLYAATVRIAS